MLLNARTRIAAALDRVALKLYTAGQRVAGTWGGRLADLVANASLGPVRARLRVEND